MFAITAELKLFNQSYQTFENFVKTCRLFFDIEFNSFNIQEKFKDTSFIKLL